MTGSKRPVRRGAFLAALCAVGVLSGCAIQERSRGGEQSVLEILFPREDYGQAARMAMNPYDANERYLGTLALANAPFAGEELYLRLFEDNIRDPDPSVRTAAARGLANHGRPDHAPLLADALADTDALVRLESARGLQRLHNPIVVSALIRRRSENEERSAPVRAEAAYALGQYREPRVFQALVQALRDTNLSVNQSAMEALRTLTGQDLGLDRAAWLAWYDSAQDPFADAREYRYRVFHRGKKIFEYFPLVPGPPNEIRSTPAGMELGDG